MNHANLALANAPSIHTPLRFFLTAPLFIILAAVILFLSGPEIFSNRWHSSILAATHSITLGFISMCIIGALFQILPVLANCHIPFSSSTSWYLLISLTTGALLLIFAFLIKLDLLFKLSIYILIPSLTCFCLIVIYSLLQSRSVIASTTGIRLAIISLLTTIFLGLVLVSGYAWPEMGLSRQYTQLHLSWAFTGWILIPITAVAYQVIPMFQVTREYPDWIKKYLLPVVFISLISLSILHNQYFQNTVFEIYLSLIFKIVIGLCFILFASYSINHLLKRNRKLADSSLLFWLTGQANLLILIAIYFYSTFTGKDNEVLIGLLFLCGVTIPIIIGMLTRIIPFLIWYHLHRNHGQLGPGISQIPQITEIISYASSRRIYRLYLFSFGLLIVSIYIPAYLFYISLVSWMLLASYLFFCILQSMRLYHSFTFKNI